MLEKQQRSFPNFISYTVPNPNPLLSYSLLIPKPTNYPPEPDPFASPDPYPHDYNGLQDRPALELDPSAVSRREIITQTADLTPHEHAGGTLGETPMVSKTLHSSGNFGVVTHHVVNNVIATKMEIENIQCTEIEVCNMTCNSEDSMKTEREGKEHLENLQKLAISSAINPNVILQNATLNVEMENKKNVILQNGETVDSIIFCDVCNEVCDNQEVFKKHLASKTHAIQATITFSAVNGLSNPTASDPQQKQAKENPTTIQSAQCELCEVNCNSYEAFNSHILGKKHLKNLKKPEKVPGPPSTTTEIQKSMKGEIVNSHNDRSLLMCSTNVHISGKKHQTNMENSQNPMGPNLPPTTEPLQNSPTDEGKVVNSKKGQSLLCELCGISCDTIDVLKIHMSGTKHQKNMKRSRSPIGPNLPLTTEPATTPEVIGPLQNSATYEGKVVNSTKGQSLWCELCGIVCNTYDVLKIHISGKKHQKNMEKSENPIGPNLPPTTKPTRVIGQLQNSAISEGKVVNSERRKRKAKSSVVSHEDLETKRQNIMKEGVAYDALRTCTLCNVVCNSPTVFEYHLAGQKHASMAAKAGSDGQKA